MQEEWLHLVDTARRHKDEVEDSKETKLQIKGSVAHHPKGKAAEECCEYVKKELVPDIVLVQH